MAKVRAGFTFIPSWTTVRSCHHGSLNFRLKLTVKVRVVQTRDDCCDRTRLMESKGANSAEPVLSHHMPLETWCLERQGA